MYFINKIEEIKETFFKTSTTTTLSENFSYLNIFLYELENRKRAEVY